MDISPANIRFMQDSICRRFRDGRSVNGSLESIINGRMKASDFPMITVVKRNEKYYSHDNRRLYVFRALHHRGMLDSVEVHVTFYFNSSKFTTTNDGISVHVRGTRTYPHAITSTVNRPLPSTIYALPTYSSCSESEDDASFSPPINRNPTRIIPSFSTKYGSSTETLTSSYAVEVSRAQPASNYRRTFPETRNYSSDVSTSDSELEDLSSVVVPSQPQQLPCYSPASPPIQTLSSTYTSSTSAVDLIRNQSRSNYRLSSPTTQLSSNISTSDAKFSNVDLTQPTLSDRLLLPTALVSSPNHAALDQSLDGSFCPVDSSRSQLPLQTPQSHLIDMSMLETTNILPIPAPTSLSENCVLQMLDQCRTTIGGLWDATRCKVWLREKHSVWMRKKLDFMKAAYLLVTKYLCKQTNENECSTKRPV